MGFLKGIDVVLHVRTPSGRDAFNRETFDTEKVTVGNVLVAPVTQGDVEILSTVGLDGKKIRYQLAIPKGDSHIWEDTLVEFFGETWRTIGFTATGIEDLIPLSWNRKVWVERYG